MPYWRRRIAVDGEPGGREPTEMACRRTNRHRVPITSTSVAGPARVPGSLNPGGISYEYLTDHPISYPAATEINGTAAVSSCD